MFFRGQIQDGRLAAILVAKKPNVEHVLNHISDMHGQILFKLGRSAAHDDIHMPLTLFCDLIKDGRLVDWPF